MHILSCSLLHVEALQELPDALHSNTMITGAGVLEVIASLSKALAWLHTKSPTLFCDSLKQDLMSVERYAQKQEGFCASAVRLLCDILISRLENHRYLSLLHSSQLKDLVYVVTLYFDTRDLRSSVSNWSHPAAYRTPHTSSMLRCLSASPALSMYLEA